MNTIFKLTQRLKADPYKFLLQEGKHASSIIVRSSRVLDDLKITDRLRKKYGIVIDDDTITFSNLSASTFACLTTYFAKAYRVESAKELDSDYFYIGNNWISRIKGWM